MPLTHFILLFHTLVLLFRVSVSVLHTYHHSTLPAMTAPAVLLGEQPLLQSLQQTQPQQHQATLYALCKTCANKENHVFTGEVYEFYQKVCKQIGLGILTQRRISDILAEFDMLGIINAEIISKGRYGRTREISLAVTETLKPKIETQLEEQLGI